MLSISTLCLYIFSIIAFSGYAQYTFIPKIMGILFVISHVIDSVVAKKKIIEVSTIHYMFLAWLLISLISGIISGASNSIDRSLTVISLFVVGVILYGTVVHARAIHLICASYVASLILSSAAVDANLLPRGNIALQDTLDFLRYSGTFNNCNAYGFACVTAIIMTIFLGKIYRSKIIKLFLVLVVIYLACKTNETGSRKAILGLLGIVGIEYFSFMIVKAKSAFHSFLRIFISSSLAGVAIVAIVLTVASTEQSSSRFKNISHYLRGESMEGGEHSLQHRFTLAKTGLDIFWENPAFGTGLASFSEARMENKFQAIGTYAHSNIIEVLVSSGMIGFTLYYGMYVIMFYSMNMVAKKNQNISENPLMMMTVSLFSFILYFDFFAVTYYEKTFFITLNLLLASIYSLTHERCGSRDEKIVY